MNPKPRKNRDCLDSATRKMSRVLSSVYVKGMNKTGLKPTQFTLLNVISSHAEITIGKLSQIMHMDQTTISRNINTLKKSALIKVVAGKDRRIRQISLTAKGQELKQAALPAWQIIQAKVWDKLGEDKVKQLFSLIDEVIELSEEI